MTDETLMEAVRRGETAKLGILVERHHRALLDFLVRMTGNSVVAEDLVQDVFVRVLKYRATWRGEGRFETWLFRIARNVNGDIDVTLPAAAKGGKGNNSAGTLKPSTVRLRRGGNGDCVARADTRAD